MKHLICLTVLACLATASNAETITVCLDGSCDFADPAAAARVILALLPPAALTQLRVLLSPVLPPGVL